MSPDEAADRARVIALASELANSADALTPRLGMRRATDVRPEFLDLMQAVDTVEAVLNDPAPARLTVDERAAAAAIAAHLSRVAELIDVQARGFSGDRTRGEIEQLAYRIHDIARRLGHLSHP